MFIPELMKKTVSQRGFGLRGSRLKIAGLGGSGPKQTGLQGSREIDQGLQARYAFLL